MKIRAKRMLYCKLILLTCVIGFSLGMSAQDRAPAPTPAEQIWKLVKDTLSKPDSDGIFENNFKDVELPIRAMEAFQGVVISATPSGRPTRIVFALTDGKTPDVTVNVAKNVQVDGRIVKAGVVIQFRGALRSFKREPFMATFDLDSPKDIGIDLFHQ
jgi:hypothetical protein